MGLYKGGVKLNIDTIPSEYLIRVKVKPEDIYFLTRIFEGYSHLGFAAPIDSAIGVVGIYTTPENNQQIIEILHNLPRKIDLIEGNN